MCFSHLPYVFWQALNCAAAIVHSPMAHMQRLKSQGHYTMDLSQTNIMKVWIFMDRQFCIRTIQTGPGAILRHYYGGFCHRVLCLTATTTGGCQQSRWWSRPRSEAVKKNSQQIESFTSSHKKSFRCQWDIMRTFCVALLCLIWGRRFPGLHFTMNSTW